MFDHIGLNVASIEASVRFYSQALGALGHTLGHQDDVSASFTAEGGSAMYLTLSPDTPSAGAHVAFTAADHDAVDRFHAAGLSAGGRDNGAPGDRPDYGEKYYAAYLLDPDGHNIEAVCMT